MIPRFASDSLLRLATGFPVLVITGPRQSGKTTLARALFSDRPYVSLENLDERAFAQEDGRGFIARFPDGAVIDEVQHVPELLSWLQTQVDDDPRPGRFVLTGSQHLGLTAQVTQSLAGRAALLELPPFSMAELRAADKLPQQLDTVLFQGLYPPLYDRPVTATDWYSQYIQTYLERDVRQLLNIHDLPVFQRFIRLCAARTGHLLNFSSLATDCGIAQSTVKTWLGVLEASYLVFRLPPHYANFGKRLVKTPKLYFYDTGLASALLSIQSLAQMNIHPFRPALFETLIVSEYCKARMAAALPKHLYFWRDNTGNEVDLVLDEGLKLVPVEIKSGQTVAADFFKGLTRWLSYAGEQAGEPVLVYGGENSYIRQGIKVVSWRKL